MGEHGSWMGLNGFEQSKIKKFRPDSCSTPADTTLTGRDGRANGQSGWVMTDMAGHFF
jgi:hypothetical protein